MSQIIQADLVVFDENLGSTSPDVIRHLATRVVEAGRATDVEGLYGDALAREGQAATGLPGGIGIPHCRSSYVTEATLAFARLQPGVDFGAPDGPADLVFLIAAPAEGDADHLTLLTALARSLVKPEFVASLREATTPDEVVALVQAAVAPAPPAAAPATESAASSAAPATESAASAPAAPASAPAAPASAPGAAAPSEPASAAQRQVVAVTACPTGIAHTYMAADSLVAAGKRAGVKVLVETQGSGASTPLGPDEIDAADAVIFATDVGVKDRGRFAGKPVVASGVKRAINEPDAMIADALAAGADPDAPRVEASASTAAPRKDKRSGDVSWAVRLRQILLTGVSYMIPFVAAGGLLIALGFLFGGYQINASATDIVANNSLANLPSGGLAQYLGAVLFSLGALAFGFLVPALSGYIAFAIADRPGIAPGFTVGVVATTVGAGFIGGIVGGLLAGFAALWISRLKVPAWGRGLMPVVVIPLGATLIAGGLMFLVLGRPLAAITSGLESWLNGLSGSSAIVLGIVLGLMMAFDMGGPVNKAAYAFATAGLAVDNPASLKVMAAVMAAGMVPPLAMALATAVRPKLFSTAERENGKAAWLLGASFITEGAIPFAAADPLRVIPSIMFGSAITGALVMAGGVTLSAPHGGIFVFFAIGHIAWFVLALLAGAVVGAAAVTVAKQLGRKPATTQTRTAVTV
ncbi:fructose-specific PTS transporter subunit EIIC [Kribbella sp. NPDC050820]|uniref:PTS fructose transporter subunit IIABC n=1 Tax=Kribbella sp. NPDC050820 TaxID=3155408 RepID=UPI0033DA75CD